MFDESEHSSKKSFQMRIFEQGWSEVCENVQENSKHTGRETPLETRLTVGGSNLTCLCMCVFQHTHTVVLLCCWRMGETLLDSFCFFSALCWTSGGLSAVLRRAFLANWPDGGDDDDDTSIVLLLLGVLLPTVLSVGLD